MGRFSPGPYKKGIPTTNAGEDQKGGPRAQFGKRLSTKTDDRDTYSAGEMGVKSEDGALGKHSFKNQAQHAPVGDKASYSMPTKNGPGVPHQPQYDLTNRGKLDDKDSVGPYTRGDSQGLLNEPGSGKAKHVPGNFGGPSKKASAHKAALPSEPVQRKVAEHLRRTPHQFRGE